ncbi:MAG: type II toxin-antitoxin system RelE/ParE family toxin [Deltaproteobacteria bacterium]|nr:type II toxin-antitoxin system RelE/ParE family toxin [Deltaproteobacteria bacterium]
MTRRAFDVRWAEGAVRDLEGIVRFIAIDSPLNAGKVVERLRTRTKGLAVLPERGRVVPELAAFGIQAYRELVVRPYRVLYRVKGRTVLVLAVLDARRDLEDLLLERLVSGGTRG